MFNATPLVRDPLPLLTQNDDQKSSIHPPLPPVIDSISINFGETIRNWLARPLSNLSSQKSPRIHPSRIEIFDRLIFHPDRGRGGWMRAQVCTLDRCRQFCCIRWTVSTDREYIYIFFFLPFFRVARFHSPSPLPLARIWNASAGNEVTPRCLIRTKLGGMWNMRGEGMIRGSLVQRIDGSKRRSMMAIDGFFLFLYFLFFFPPPRKTNEIEIYFLYTRVIKFNVTGEFWILSKCMYEKLDEGWINDAERSVIIFFDSN